jgi:hypothetical protein
MVLLLTATIVAASFRMAIPSRGARTANPAAVPALRQTRARGSLGYHLDQLKREVVSLSSQQQAELISYTLHLRYAGDPDYRREVTDRLNDSDKSHWLSPAEFKRRLDGLIVLPSALRTALEAFVTFKNSPPAPRHSPGA